jgi:hypothetical protein
MESPDLPLSEDTTQDSLISFNVTHNLGWWCN